ncbi:MAG: hypothetical protein ABSE49_30875 [Polyangiaceae bacterium]|jgi:hypothetical protein
MSHLSKLAAFAAALVGAMLLVSSAFASGAPQLHWVYGGTNGQTIVFIHGKADCSKNMSDCNGGGAGYELSYWMNTSTGANQIADMRMIGSASYDAFTIGFDLDTQGYWGAANDVGNCLTDLYSGTNSSGCNPSYYKRSSFNVVTHSAGATVMDRLLSTGWFGVNAHVTNGVAAIAPALTGSFASSVLYNQSNANGAWYCNNPITNGIIEIFGQWALGNAAAASLTNSTVLGQANQLYAGRSPIWFNKIVSYGGSGSANNANNIGVNESANDTEMGLLACYLGYSSSNDMDGLLYWSDTDPTNNTSANGCSASGTAYSGTNSCHYFAQFTGSYWHWITTWANHSHSRDDAYDTVWGAGCYGLTNGYTFPSPGGCIGNYAF